MLPEAVGAGTMPQMRRYLVTGIFDTGYPEFDSRLACVSLAAARRDMGGSDRISGVRIRLLDPFEADRVEADLKGRLSGADSLVVSSWITDHASLYSSIRTEKWAFFLALTLIVVVAGFNIVSILTMNVAERRREVGILKTMGCTRRHIARIFTLQGLAIGVLGIAIGDLLGVTLCWLQMRYELVRIPGDIFIIQALPVEMRLLDFALVSLCAVVLCYLFTRLPARDAGSLDPVEAIRL
jgi:lipoprotein-releasing system permease protein